MRIAIVFVFVLAIGVLLSTTASAQTFRATINEAQEVPPTASAALGQGCFTYNATSMMLTFEVSYSGLGSAETGAHIHGPALAGSNAGVQFALPLGTPKVGAVGPLSAGQEADLFNGLYYVNIHTSGFPGGEIRGQITSHPTPCTVPTRDSTWGSVKALFEVQ